MKKSIREWRGRVAALALTAGLGLPGVALAQDADARLEALMEDHWAYVLEENPIFATATGEHAYDDRLGSLSIESVEADFEKHAAFLERLDAIERDALSEENRLNYDLLRHELADEVARGEHDGYLLTLTNRGGWHLNFTRLPTRHPFFDREDYDNYISRLKDYPRYNAEGIARLDKAVEEGWTQPCVSMEGYENTISAHIVDDPEESALWAPFERMPATIPQAERDRLKAEAREVIETEIVPAYEDFYAFYTGTYMPNCREDVGASGWPEGRAYYDYLARHFTTTDMSVEAIHELGLSEVARIRGEMQGVLDRVEFEGSIQEFIDFLRTDERFYAKTPKELVDYVAYLSKKADGEMPKLFGTLPRLPYTVKPVPADIAEKTTVAYYERGSSAAGRPGIYRINTTKLDSRPLYTMPALTIHEAVPGHHHQITLAQELDLPPFRRYMGPTAYIEGWGLYSERLGIEMGFYEDPYDDFGRLSYEMWRAVRLVVDTGLHAFGWTRQEAIDYMAANTALSLHNVEAEIDRYITWPGQALAYKIGELKIRELRADAEERLGENFDIRQFHDELLLSGAMPLSVLEAQIRRWTEAQEAAAE